MVHVLFKLRKVAIYSTIFSLILQPVVWAGLTDVEIDTVVVSVRKTRDLSRGDEVGLRDFLRLHASTITDGLKAATSGSYKIKREPLADVTNATSITSALKVKSPGRLKLERDYGASQTELTSARARRCLDS